MRPHLLRGGLALFVIMIAAFLSKRFIIDVLLMGPQSPDFPTNRILCHISHRLLGDATLCINSIKLNMINTALGGQFNLHMQVSMVTGVVLAVPYLLWELWRFVAPALTDYERYKSRMFVFYVSLCFFTGLLFGYFLIVPLSINFLAGYQASPDIANMIDVKSYLSTVLTVSVACAIVFQLPLLIYFLARMGIVTAAFLRKNRRYAIVLLAIVSAVITPPDVFSLFGRRAALFAVRSEHSAGSPRRARESPGGGRSIGIGVRTGRIATDVSGSGDAAVQAIAKHSRFEFVPVVDDVSLGRWMKESEHVCLCECTLIFPDMMVGTAGEDGRFAYRPTCGGRAVRFRKAFR